MGKRAATSSTNARSLGWGRKGECGMKGFIPLKRNCPICNGDRSDCRQSQKTGIVHCRANLSSLPTGWKFIKDDAWGFGMYAQTSEEANSEQWQQRQQERSLQRQREREELRRGTGR